MLIIGLTGGIGSGKSTVARYFGKLGVPVIDADQIAHKIVSPQTLALRAIVEKCGKEVLFSNGRLNRHYLKSLIFRNPKLRKWLEGLLHPLIYTEIIQRLSKLDVPYCVVVIPLLIETKSDNLVDRILVVDADPKMQVARIRQRDQLSPNEAKAILAAQASREQRLARANDIVLNNGSKYNLKQQINALHKKYLTMAVDDRDVCKKK